MRSPIPWALALSVLAACASVDPAGDIAASAAAAEARLGVAPDLTGDWRAAPDWDGSRPLSSDEALSIAFLRNRELRLAVTDIAAARAALAGAETPPNPMVSLSVGLPLDAMGTGLTAAAMQQLAWLWQRPTRVAAEEARLRAATLDAADRAIAIATRIQSEFAGVVASEASLRARVRGAQAAREALSAIDAGVAAGSIPAFERRNAADALAMAEREIGMAGAGLAKAKSTLLVSLGLAELGDEWTTDGTWPVVKRRATEPELAARGRLDVAAAEAKLLAAEADARTAGSARIPSVSAGAMYERMTDGSETLGPAIELELPIFDRGDSRIAAALASVARARLEADVARQSAVAEAKLAAQTARLAWKRLHEGSEVRRALAASAVQQLAAQVEAGTAPRLELGMASMALAARESEAIEDRLAAVEAEFLLARTVGIAPPQGDRP